MKVKIQAVNIYVTVVKPEKEEKTSEEEPEEEDTDQEPAVAGPVTEAAEEEEKGKEEVETPKKKKFPIPVNSPESFAICRRIAAEERERRGKAVNPISGKAWTGNPGSRGSPSRPT